ncbi:hypothetical protein B296_00000378 [Ensete ventricosum]|uniref:DUF659 domain-containing protein n=1 Tax=Ensete ventricosum TaxID=4639 RepID=A0A427BBM1_ENSVE|nr:hypothetical protein B296_00000378 [Ensete ventricosum]
MPSIYNGIYSAKLAIKAVHADNEQKYGPFWSVLDNHWNSVFHHPLYVAAYFLNPSYRYRPNFMAVREALYHNAEQAESYGTEINENEEFNGGSKKTSTYIALPELLETSGAHPAGASGAATDEDDTDLDFLDDDLDD